MRGPIAEHSRKYVVELCLLGRGNACYLLPSVFVLLLAYGRLSDYCSSDYIRSILSAYLFEEGALGTNHTGTTGDISNRTRPLYSSIHPEPRCFLLGPSYSIQCASRSYCPRRRCQHWGFTCAKVFPSESCIAGGSGVYVCSKCVARRSEGLL